MGSLFKSKSTSVTDPGAAEAWNIARPTQEYANTAGVNFTQDVMANPAYSGQRVAGLNPFQTSGADFTGNFAQNFGQGFAQNLTGSGNSMLNAGAGFGQNANSIYSQYSGIDPTQQILANANSYANNPYADGMIDAANRDVTRGLYEQQLPTLARGLAGSGNTNSTRGGVESAILQRGAADRMADTASNIRGTLFNTGLGQAQSQFNQNLQNSLQANQGLLSAYQTGGQAGLQGLGANGDLFNQMQAAGGVYQGYDQNLLNANKSYFDESLANRAGALTNLSGIAKNTEAKTSAGVATQPSIASQIGGGLMAAGSMGFKPFAPSVPIP